VYRWLVLRRIHLPRTWVNKGKKKRKGRRSYALGPPAYLIAVKLALLRALRRFLLLPFPSPPQLFFHLLALLLH
jgi:hypothetical protein